jgi:hypothetical protein
MAAELLRVPLRKRRGVDDELYVQRVAHERERVRRRAQESDDGPEQLEQGALVFSEAPLGVGYGCASAWPGCALMVSMR